MTDLILKNIRPLGREDRCDILVDGGKIQEVASTGTLNLKATKRLDCQGKVLSPGLLECHIHLEKAYIEKRMPNISGTLSEAIANTGQLKDEFTREDIKIRAERVIKKAISYGTTALRAHVEIEPKVGLMGLEVIKELQREYRDRLDIQITLFPQDGIARTPGTLELLHQAAKTGVDAMGGIPYIDDDHQDHTRQVFDLAEKYDLPLDMHVDFSDNPRHQTIRYIAQLAIERDYIGRVSVGHLTSLGSMDKRNMKEIIELLKKAEIDVITLPITDLYLNGRGDRIPEHRGLTPVNKLLQVGINVAAASNNIQNAFTPFGRADLLLIAFILSVAGHMGTREGQIQSLNAVTYGAAKVMGLKNYGLDKGCNADFCLLDTEYSDTILSDLPQRLAVFKKGRLISGSWAKK